MLIRLEARTSASRAMVYGSPVIAVVLTLAASLIMFALLGTDPLGAVYTYFIHPVSSARGIAELLVKATPLVLIAIGLSLGFRANVWNIGAEGQLTLGALCGGGLGLAFYGVDSVLLLPAMLAAGIAGGMAWAAIPAFLKTRFNTNEILTSLMLVYVALLLLSYLIHGPWKDPEGFNFPESRLFSRFGQGSGDHAGDPPPHRLADRPFRSGARVGASRKARHRLSDTCRRHGSGCGRICRFRRKSVVWMTLLASGGAAGLAGVIEVAGPIGQIVPVISPGYGFTAIIVAFLGRLHPVGVVLAGLLMALTYLGGEYAQITMNLPNAVTGVFQGMLLFFLLASDVLITHRIRLGGIRNTRKHAS